MPKKIGKLRTLLDAAGEWLSAQVDAVDIPTRRWLLRSVLLTGVVALLLYGVGAGLKHAEGYVHSMPQYDHPLVLEWVDLPDWLRLPENGHIVDSLVARIDLRDTDRLLDPRLVSRLGAALTAPDVGWVKVLERIEARPDGVVAVKCQFRKPRAWVQQGACCYLVDDAGVRLPGRYDVNQCKGTALTIITGVAAKPPAVGQKWSAADLAAGLKLTALILTRPFQSEIASVDVANFDGRTDRNRSHLELVTDPKGPRIWWGRPPLAEQGIEISAAQKITLLETLYRQWGHFGVNRPYIDIRTWPDRIAMPMPIPPPGQSRILRG